MSEIQKLRDLPATHLLGTGTPMCAGCGGLAVLHEVYDILGTRTVFVNAAGCMTLLAVYPFTPFRGSWLYTAMASAPAGAQGVRDALDILCQQGKIKSDEDLQVVVLTGDGSAYGMGLNATSGAMDRKLDFIYLCYDNEGYGNTGQQYSGATPMEPAPPPAGASGAIPGSRKIFLRYGPRTGRRTSPPSSAVSRWIWPGRSKKPRVLADRGCLSPWLPAPPVGTLTPPRPWPSASWRWKQVFGRSRSTVTARLFTAKFRGTGCRWRSTCGARGGLPIFSIPTGRKICWRQSSSG